jgi:hypothetical protein
MSRGVPIYPVLLALALVLSIVVPSGASPYAALRLLVAFAVGGLLLAAAARFLLGDRDRAGVAATVLVLFAFKGIDWRLASLLLIALALIVVERLAAARRPSRVPWAIVGRVMNAGAVVLLVAVFLRSAGDGSLGTFLDAIRSEGPAALREPPDGAIRTDGAPDVLLFILDGHARADKLDTIFGFDGGRFVGALESRGFEVASASRSNYLLTAQSLPSLLNMAPLSAIVDVRLAAASSSGFTAQIRPVASNPRVFKEFRARGYEVIAIASGFEEVALRGADRFIDTGQINELETRTLGNTVVAPAIQLVAPDWFADQQRSRVVSVFEAAVAVAGESRDRPRFVVVHVPSPHAPIVFAADGSAVPMSDLPNFFDDTFTHRTAPRQEALAQYAGQVAHIDDLALDALDRVLAAPMPRVVLVVSDHGSAAGVRWDDLLGSDLDERTANLFAAYTPGRPDVFPSDISLVNVFGLLFEEYFGRDYDPQPNTAYRWKDSLVDEIPIPLPRASTP